MKYVAIIISVIFICLVISDALNVWQNVEMTKLGWRYDKGKWLKP